MTAGFRVYYNGGWTPWLRKVLSNLGPPKRDPGLPRHRLRYLCEASYGSYFTVIDVTWTSKIARIVDPIWPILSIFGYCAIILGSFGGPGSYIHRRLQKRHVLVGPQNSRAFVEFIRGQLVRLRPSLRPLLEGTYRLWTLRKPRIPGILRRTLLKPHTVSEI